MEWIERNPDSVRTGTICASNPFHFESFSLQILPHAHVPVRVHPISRGSIHMSVVLHTVKDTSTYMPDAQFFCQNSVLREGLFPFLLEIHKVRHEKFTQADA